MVYDPSNICLTCNGLKNQLSGNINHAIVRLKLLLDDGAIFRVAHSTAPVCIKPIRYAILAKVITALCAITPIGVLIDRIATTITTKPFHKNLLAPSWSVIRVSRQAYAVADPSNICLTCRKVRLKQLLDAT
jgi:hypothetical protein